MVSIFIWQYDYQYAYFGTPFIDLILFIHSSTSDSVRMNHDEYLQYYYNNLKNVLQKLGYKKKVPTLFEFRQQYAKKSFLSKSFWAFSDNFLFKIFSFNRADCNIYNVSSND